MAAFLRQNERYLQSVSGYLELAMMIETQALDLYLRMASESANPITKEVLFRVSEEEKAHLTLLGQYLDRNQGGVS
jgi:rubrerythrin